MIISSEDLCDVLHEPRVGVAEGDELVEVDAAVAVGVDLGHHALHLVGGGGPQRPQRLRQLRQRDLAVAVGVEPLEDPLHVRRLRHCRRPLGRRRSAVRPLSLSADSVRSTLISLFLYLLR